MRIPRMTTRRWMTAVAVLALVLALGVWGETIDRRRAYESEAKVHFSLADGHLQRAIVGNVADRQSTNNDLMWAHWHQLAAGAFMRAAQRPWDAAPVQLPPPPPR